MYVSVRFELLNIARKKQQTTNNKHNEQQPTTNNHRATIRRIEQLTELTEEQGMSVSKTIQIAKP